MQTQTETNGHDVTTSDGHDGALPEARPLGRDESVAAPTNIVHTTNGRELEVGSLFVRAQQFIHKIVAEARHDATEIVAEAQHDATEIVHEAMAEAAEIVAVGRERARQIVQEEAGSRADSAVPSETVQQLVRTIEILSRSNTELTRELTNLRSSSTGQASEGGAGPRGVPQAQITVNRDVHTRHTWQIQRPASSERTPTTT